MKNTEAKITRRRILQFSALGAVGASPLGQLLCADVAAQTNGLAGKKTLVLYYSKTDTTGTLARQLHSIVGGDIAKLEPVTPYPVNYTATTDQAKKEQTTNYRPPVKPISVDINSYDIIFLGYPNWWGTLPMSYFTFLEQNNLAGKVVAPFATHEGSYLGSGVADMKRLCPNATILEGYAVRGKSSDSSARRDLTMWLQQIGMA